MRWSSARSSRPHTLLTQIMHLRLMFCIWSQQGRALCFCWSLIVHILLFHVVFDAGTFLEILQMCLQLMRLPSLPVDFQLLTFSLSLRVQDNIIDWTRWRQGQPLQRPVLAWAFLFGDGLCLVHVLFHQVHSFLVREVGWCALKSSDCTFINLIVGAGGVHLVELLTLLIQIW